jgi:hypothetical protein
VSDKVAAVDKGDSVHVRNSLESFTDNIALDVAAGERCLKEKIRAEALEMVCLGPDDSGYRDVSSDDVDRSDSESEGEESQASLNDSSVMTPTQSRVRGLDGEDLEISCFSPFPGVCDVAAALVDAVPPPPPFPPPPPHTHTHTCNTGDGGGC